VPDDHAVESGTMKKLLLRSLEIYRGTLIDLLRVAGNYPPNADRPPASRFKIEPWSEERKSKCWQDIRSVESEIAELKQQLGLG
jgi:hypothetical protein